jgi:hypothetical protein
MTAMLAAGFKPIRLAAMVGGLSLTAVGFAGCTGGCWHSGGPVSTAPETPCLTLFVGGSATETRICGFANLGGRNGCDEALTLPPIISSGKPTVVQPGDSIDYHLA